MEISTGATVVEGNTKSGDTIITTTTTTTTVTKVVRMRTA
jgi:hypothetical protein